MVCCQINARRKHMARDMARYRPGACRPTKVSFLYIGLCFIALLLLTDRPIRLRASPQGRRWTKLLSTYAVVALAMFAPVVPWIVRNSVLFGNPQIASGTEATVLSIRTPTTEQPLLGQIYVTAPPTLRELVIGPLTGYTEDDLTPGGRLAPLLSLKDDKWETSNQRMTAEGFQGDKREWLKRSALDAALNNPLRYVESIGVFALKGMWFLQAGGGVST